MSDEEQYVKTEVVTEENILELSERTGKPAHEIAKLYQDAVAQGKTAVMLVDPRPWWERDG